MKNYEYFKLLLKYIYEKGFMKSLNIPILFIAALCVTQKIAASTHSAVSGNFSNSTVSSAASAAAYAALSHQSAAAPRLSSSPTPSELIVKHSANGAGSKVKADYHQHSGLQAAGTIHHLGSASSTSSSAASMDSTLRDFRKQLDTFAAVQQQILMMIQQLHVLITGNNNSLHASPAIHDTLLHPPQAHFHPPFTAHPGISIGSTSSTPDIIPAVPITSQPGSCATSPRHDASASHRTVSPANTIHPIHHDSAATALLLAQSSVTDTSSGSGTIYALQTTHQQQSHRRSSASAAAKPISNIEHAAALAQSARSAGSFNAHAYHNHAAATTAVDGSHSRTTTRAPSPAVRIHAYALLNSSHTTATSQGVAIAAAATSAAAVGTSSSFSAAASTLAERLDALTQTSLTRRASTDSHNSDTDLFSGSGSGLSASMPNLSALAPASDAAESDSSHVTTLAGATSSTSRTASPAWLPCGSPTPAQTHQIKFNKQIVSKLAHDLTTH